MNTRIVFMGTPDFAVPSLAAVIASGYNVVGVFSQPDRPQGRGYKLVPTPVKQLALDNSIPVFQPASLKEDSAISKLKELKPDLIVVVAYGKILPKAILDIPPLGCINVHGSILPKLRGAAPIQWSILNGDDVTGVTTMFMGEGMDTGDIILISKTPITENETSGELFERLAPMGADLLKETLPLVISGNAPRTPQVESDATYAPMITKQMGAMDFGSSAKELHNLVRGLYPWPKAYCFYYGTRVIVNKTAVVENNTKNNNPGEILDAKKLIVACKTGSIQFLDVQVQGKKAVSGSDFANGNHIKNGYMLTHVEN